MRIPNNRKAGSWLSDAKIDGRIGEGILGGGRLNFGRNGYLDIGGA